MFYERVPLSFQSLTTVPKPKHNTTMSKRIREVLSQQYVSRSELLEVLESASRESGVVSVTFTKLPNPEEAAEFLKGITASDVEHHSQRLALVKRILTGNLRELNGPIRRFETHFGRTIIFDLDENGERQVDHRTIIRLVYNQTVYNVKKP